MLFLSRDRSGCGLLVLALLVTTISGAYALMSLLDGKWGAGAVFGGVAVGGLWLAGWSRR